MTHSIFRTLVRLEPSTIDPVTHLLSDTICFTLPAWEGNNPDGGRAEGSPDHVFTIQRDELPEDVARVVHNRRYLHVRMNLGELDPQLVRFEAWESE